MPPWLSRRRCYFCPYRLGSRRYIPHAGNPLPICVFLLNFKYDFKFFFLANIASLSVPKQTKLSLATVLANDKSPCYHVRFYIDATPSLSKYKKGRPPSYLQLSSCLVPKHIHPENSRTTLSSPCKISARMALGLLYPHFMELRYTIRAVARLSIEHQPNLAIVWKQLAYNREWTCHN
jgi:hypothetical protein